MVRGRIGNRRLSLPIVALATMALLCLGLGVAVATAPEPENPRERELLRLHDLPPGFFPGLLGPEGSEVEFFCDSLHPDGAGQRVDSYLRRFAPEGCMGVYLRFYRVPGGTPAPAIAGTGVLENGDVVERPDQREAGALTGFALAGQILASADEGIREASATEQVGEETRLFHWPRVPNLLPPTILSNPHRASFLVWRWHQALGVTFATASSFAVSDAIAAELARRQQAHLENPTVYTAAERDFSEVALDDPRLQVPVYWLGRDFAPAHGLPGAHLEGSFPASRRDSEPDGISLAYSDGIQLDARTPATWKRFAASREGRRLLAHRCGRSTELRLSGASATVFAAYGRPFESCPKRPPRRFFAIVRLPGAITAVNLGECLGCGFNSPYNSLAGIKMIVRGLRLRPPPVYPAPPARARR
jgi:hypothetical protein